jgi:HEAT repeat protein
MARRRRRFGPLLYGTLALGVVEVLVLIGQSAWPGIRDRWEAAQLVAALRDPSPLVRGNAADGLVKLGSASWSGLIAAMRDPDETTRRSACETLLLTRPDARLAVPAYLDALRDPSPSVRALAARGLAEAYGAGGSIAPIDWSGAVEALRVPLRDGDPAVRKAVALALQRFGKRARSALGDLTGRLDDPAPMVRLLAVEAICTIDGRRNPEAISALLTLIARREPLEPWLRWSAVRFARSVVPEAEPVVIRSLTALLDEPDAEVRREAIYCLRDYGPRAVAAVPTLLRALRSSDEMTRVQIAYALALIEPRSNLLVLPEMFAVAFAPRSSPVARSGAALWFRSSGILPRSAEVVWVIELIAYYQWVAVE